MRIFRLVILIYSATTRITTPSCRNKYKNKKDKEKENKPTRWWWFIVAVDLKLNDRNVWGNFGMRFGFSRFVLIQICGRFMFSWTLLKIRNNSVFITIYCVKYYKSVDKIREFIILDYEIDCRVCVCVVDQFN